MAKKSISFLWLWLCMFVASTLHAQNWEALKDQVVKIETPQGHGTGLMVGTRSGQVFILTAAHVVQGIALSEISILFRSYEPHPTTWRRVENARLDIAVLKCALPRDLTLASAFAWSESPLEFQQQLYLIGHPASYSWEINTDCSVKDTEYNYDPDRFSLTPQGLTPGSSGSPIFDAAFGLVGILTSLDQVKAFATQRSGIKRIFRAWNIPQNLMGGDRFRPKMIRIPGGSFQMGDDEEKPVHRVSVSAFSLAETEVTNEQFCVFLNEKGNQEEGGVTWLEMSHYVQIEEKNGTFTPKSGMAQHPVVGVSWYGASAYCKWLGTGYRLPTEAEWEYAAGGGAGTRTEWAGTDSEAQLREYGNYSGTGGSDSYSRTAPVKSFRPNALGLYDLCGNVWEWCQDWYGSYSSNPSQDPQGPASGSYRVYRGGSWYNDPLLLRVAVRGYWYPVDRNGVLGFRPARNP